MHTNWLFLFLSLFCANFIILFFEDSLLYGSWFELWIYLYLHTNNLVGKKRGGGLPFMNLTKKGVGW